MKNFERYKKYISIEKKTFDNVCDYYYITIKKDISNTEHIVPRLHFTSSNDYKDSKSLYDIMKDGKHLFGVNAGLFNTKTLEPECLIVKDNTALMDRLETYVHVNPNDGEEKRHTMYFLGIDNNGNLKFFEPSYTAQDLVDMGIVDAFMGFAPLMVDGVEFDKIDELVPFGAYLNKQRQVIGQHENGDYFIVTVLEPGLTFKQTRKLLTELNIKNAYALDNGSSTQTIFHTERLTPVYRDITGRKIPTILIFNPENKTKRERIV